MRKIYKYREVELVDGTNIDFVASSYWRTVDSWLKRNGFTRKDIVGEVFVNVGLKYLYSFDETPHPVLYATFRTRETDQEFKERKKEQKNLTPS